MPRRYLWRLPRQSHVADRWLKRIRVFRSERTGHLSFAEQLRVVDLPNVLENEPNNTIAETTASISLPAAFNGIVQQAGDLDHFKFTAKKESSTTCVSTPGERSARRWIPY